MHLYDNSLLARLAECFRVAWSRLVSVSLPWCRSFYNRSRAVALASALAASPSLEVAYAGGEYPKTRHDSREDDVKILATSTSIRAIHITPKLSADQQFINNVNADAKLQKLVVFHKPISDLDNLDIHISPSLDPSFVPLSNVSGDVRDMIWSRVLWFAMDIDKYKDGFFAEKSETKALRRNRATFLLVSKTFSRLSTSYFYGYPIISNGDALESFADRLSQDRTLGSYVRSLHFHQFSFWDSPDNESLRRVLSRVPHLIRLDSSPCSSLRTIDVFDYHAHLHWDGFETLANIAGPVLVTLRNLIIDDGFDTLRTPIIFHRFTSLRFMSGKMGAVFNTDLGNIPAQALYQLETIEMESCSSSFLEVLSQMDLNALRKVKLPEHLEKEPIAFLRKHGPKILDLGIALRNAQSIDFCQTITVLTIFVHKKSLDPKILKAHPCIEKIIICTPTSVSTHHGIPHQKEWIKFFKFVDLTRFPSLGEFEVHQCVWPTTEHEISKSIWPGFSERLAKWNVKLVDKQGRCWRPRLTKSGR